jgi:S-(hydroxymethyl)glutathione dehydrogenase/alcohol dehydrogenase
MAAALTNDRMKAAVFRGTGVALSIEDVELDRAAPREVLVKTVAAGLCHSDLSVITGQLEGYITDPSVAGHEAAGIVLEVGAGVRYVRPGDHVVTCLSQFCGTCEFCLSGRPYLCQAQGVLRNADDGARITQRGQPLGQYEGIAAFAERLLVHETAVVKVDASVQLDCAALLGCGVTPGLGAALNTAQVGPGSSCAVIGCGGVGLAVVQGCFIAGAARIVAVDLRSSNLERARKLGATDSVDASAGDAVEVIRQLTSGGVDYAFEVVGSRATAEQAFRMTRPGGMAVIVGWTNQDMTVNIGDLIYDRVLRGSMMGSNRFRIDIPRWLELHRQGRLRLEELITARLNLDQINDGFSAMVEGTGVRSIVIFQ